MLTCTFEDGQRAKQGLRHVTVDTLVVKDGKLLLVKRASSLLEGGKWGLLGGFVDRDETLSEAVEREVMEESGYNVKDIKLLRVKDNPNRPREDRQNISFVFVCEATQKTAESDWEVDDIQWFSMSDVPNKENIAFDHYDDITLYRQHLNDNSVISMLD